MESDSANPVQGNKVPSQGTSNRANVDRSRCCGVAEVGKGQVEEVDDQEKLAQPEVGPDPEVDETEQQQVRCNIVGANVGSGRGVDSV